MHIKIDLTKVKDTTIQRFWNKVNRNCGVQSDRVSTPCWEWLGTRGQRGYGFFRVNGKMLKAHRFAYALCVGPIPNELDLDHLCHNTACVNPDHLEPTTNSNHMRNHILLGDTPCGYQTKKRYGEYIWK